MQYTIILAPSGGVEPCESAQIDFDGEVEDIPFRDIVDQLDDVDASDFDEEDLDHPLGGHPAYDIVCWMPGFVEVNFP